VACVFVTYFLLGGLVKDVLRRRNPLKRYRDYKRSRGMSAFHDMFDWLGGYPYEVAKPGEIFEMHRKLGFSLERLATVGRGHGCNQYVFRRL
jgi:2-polyprenyl-6-hydroxyphenyl methylase/3-demethylubiquinone-9 3-methyltransferase